MYEADLVRDVRLALFAVGITPSTDETLKFIDRLTQKDVGIVRIQPAIVTPEETA